MKQTGLIVAIMAIALTAFGGPPAGRGTQQSLSDYETVRRAMQFSVGPVGIAAETAPAEAAFRKLLQSPGAAQTCRRLLAEATTVGQLYGLLGLKLLNDPGYATVAPRYKVSESVISMAGGCIVSPIPVTVIVKKIDSGEIK